MAPIRWMTMEQIREEYEKQPDLNSILFDLIAKWEPPAATWTDGYGTERTAAEMTTEHLFNVMAYVRDRLSLKGKITREKLMTETPFYFEATKELAKRGLL